MTLKFSQKSPNSSHVGSTISPSCRGYTPFADVTGGGQHFLPPGNVSDLPKHCG